MMERTNINMTWWWYGRMSVCFYVCWLMSCSSLLVFVYSKSSCIILPLDDLIDASFEKILLKNCFLTEDIYYLFDWLVNMTKEDAAWWQDILHSFSNRNSLIIHSFYFLHIYKQIKLLKKKIYKIKLLIFDKNLFLIMTY